MTWVDLIVLAVLAVSALLAFVRGLVRELLGLGAWVGAATVAVWARPLVTLRLQGWLGASLWTDMAALGVVFLISLIALMIVSHWIGALVRASPIGGLDRTLGLVFGLARGAALVVLAYYIVAWAERPARWPEPVREALSLRAAYFGAHWVWERLPERFQPEEPKPPPGRATTAEALLHANPQGRAVGKPLVRD